jgi:hypothetical protein
MEARALYRQVVDELLPPTAPQPWRDAQQAARTEIEALDKRIPSLRIMVRGGGGRGLRVTVDDAEVASYGEGHPLSVDPGAHRVVVVPMGGAGVSRSVDAAEGARVVVEIELPGAAPVVAAAPPPPPRPPPAPPPGRWLVPPLMAFGVGVVGLGVGAGAGIAALKSASALRARCGKSCPPTMQDEADRSAGLGLATASTVGFVLAGAGVVTGTVLMLVKPRPPPQAAVVLGPGSIEVTGVF